MTRLRRESRKLREKWQIQAAIWLAIDGSANTKLFGLMKVNKATHRLEIPTCVLHALCRASAHVGNHTTSR